MSVRHWRILIISLVLISLTGCGIFSKEPVVKVSTVPVQKTPLGIELPAPLEITPTEWVVITADNAVEVFTELESNGQAPVLVAITPTGYKRLSLTFTEIRQLIDQQRQIIIQYKNYYETVEGAQDGSARVGTESTTN